MHIFTNLSVLWLTYAQNFRRKLQTMIMDERLILPGEIMMILMSTSGVIFETNFVL